MFFLLGVLTRLPFTSRLLYHWDSVNFALGMERFDVRLHQPHPPGYLLYVLMGRLLQAIFQDANTSLVVISLLFSGLTVAVVYLLARQIFDRQSALVAGLFTLTSPAVWFYGEVALTYILESFFVTAIALACLQALRGQRRMVYAAAILLGLAGGIRQTTLVLMLPLLAFVLLRWGWRERILGALALGVTVLAWLAPTIALSGGLNDYLEASRSIGGGVLDDFELLNPNAGLVVRLSPLLRLGAYVGYGLMLAAIPLLYGTLALLSRWRSWRNWIRDARWQVMALWLLPNLIVYAPLVRAPGHTFSFITALLILAGGAWTQLVAGLAGRIGPRARAWTDAALGSVLLINVAFFLGAPGYLFGERRIITTTPTRETIAYRDVYIGQRTAYIDEHFDPARTLVLANGPDFRHPAYYLRAYTAVQTAATIPAGVETLVLFSSELEHPAAETAMLPNGETISWLAVHPGAQVIVEDGRLTVLP